MKKKLLALLLALVMVISLAACGAAETPAATTAAANSAADTNNAEEQTPEVSGETLKIGLTAPLTSSDTAGSEHYERGARMAVDNINAAGGINGRMLELVVYDNEALPESAAKNVTRMVEVDKVSAIVGCYLSSNVLASYEITEAAGIMMIQGGLSPSTSNIGASYLARGACVSNYYAEETFVTLMKNSGAEKVAVLAVETEYGQTGVADMERLIPEFGMELAVVETFQYADSDFTAQTTKIVAANPDAVVLYVSSGNDAIIVKQLRRAGYTGPIYGDVSVIQQDGINVAGEDANGIVGVTPFITFDTIDGYQNEEVKAVVQQYVDTYGELPTKETMFRAYGAVMVIAEGMKNAENIDDPKSIAEAIWNLSDFQCLGATFDYSSRIGEGITLAPAYMYVNDTVQQYDQAILEEYLASVE